MPIGAFKLNSISMAAAQSVNVSATGGTTTVQSIGGTTYKIHTFTTVGNTNFVVSTGGLIDALIVGGGGGAAGGTNWSSINMGGAGAGGRVVQLTGTAVTPQTYVMTVGGGGSGASDQNQGTAGTASSAFSNSAAGGGGGSYGQNATNGGGAGVKGDGSSTSWTSSAGTSAYKGGNAFGSATQTNRGSGGGSGAGAAGTNASSGTGGAGGAGLTINFDGTSRMYSPGGGGSGASTAGLSGNGLSTAGSGAGRSVQGNGDSQTQNYGGGGGAGYAVNGSYTGGSGNQGIILVRYPYTPVSSLSYIGGTISSTTSLTVPATVQAGDLLIFVSTARNTSTTAPTAPTMTGWSNTINVSATSTTGYRQVVYYKIATAGDASSTITCMSGTASTRSIIMIYRGDKAISVIEPNWGTGGQATTNAPTNQTLTMTGVTGPYVAIANYYSSGTITTRGSTTTATGEISSGTGFYIKRFDSTSSSVSFNTSTISMADYGDNVLSTTLFKVY